METFFSSPEIRARLPVRRRLNKITFERFQSFILKESGLHFRDHQIKTLEGKNIERMVACNFATHEEYLDFLMFNKDGRPEFKSLLDLLTVGETYFFRNPAQLSAIKGYVIPRLKSARSMKFNIWCAGCSSGEEPYTLAILLKDYAPYINFSIIATDINRFSMRAAHKGIYYDRSVRNVSPRLLKKYFRKRRDTYIISDEIKSKVNFFYHNLAGNNFSHPFLQNINLLLCRNVTIYFDKKTSKRVIDNFTSCLVPGGHLFIGHAETLRGISDSYRIIKRPYTFAYEKLEGHKEGACKPEQKVLIKKRVEESFLVKEPKKSEPDEKEDYLAIAKRGFERNRYDEAIRSIDSHLEGEPGSYSALLMKSEILGNQKVYNRAIGCVDRAIRSDRFSTEAYHLKGTLLAEMGKYEDAVRQFNHVLYLDPENCISHYHLGNMFRAMGDVTKAIHEYETCVNLLGKKKEEAILDLSKNLRSGHLYVTVASLLRELRR